MKNQLAQIRRMSCEYKLKLVTKHKINSISNAGNSDRTNVTINFLEIKSFKCDAAMLDK